MEVVERMRMMRFWWCSTDDRLHQPRACHLWMLLLPQLFKKLEKLLRGKQTLSEMEKQDPLPQEWHFQV